MCLISIAIPTYNSESTICDAVSSCLEQSFRDFELVIVDDASTDGTLERVRSFADPRIRVVGNSRNLGAVHNWNQCIDKTTGDYLLILHHDDWLFPDALDALHGVTSACPGVGLVVLRGREAGRPTPGEEIRLSRDRRFVFHPAGIDAVAGLLRSGTYCSSAVVRRDAYRACGRFNTEFRYSADEEMWLRIAKQRDVAIRLTPAVGVRSGGEHLMYRTWGERDFWGQWQKILEEIMRYADEVDTAGEYRREIHWLAERKMVEAAHYITKHFLRVGDRKAARRYLELARLHAKTYRRPRRQFLFSVMSRLPSPLARAILGNGGG